MGLLISGSGARIPGGPVLKSRAVSRACGEHAGRHPEQNCRVLAECLQTAGRYVAVGTITVTDIAGNSSVQWAGTGASAPPSAAAPRATSHARRPPSMRPRARATPAAGSPAASSSRSDPGLWRPSNTHRRPAIRGGEASRTRHTHHQPHRQSNLHQIVLHHRSSPLEPAVKRSD